MNERRFLSVWPTLIRDLAGLAGAGMISAGAGMIYLPAGLIVAGFMLVAAAVLSARAAG